MILGLSSFGFSWSIGIEGQKPLQAMHELDLVRATIDDGLSCLQIGDNLPLHSLSVDQLEKLKTALIENNIRIEIGARRLTAEHLRQYMDLANYLNSPLLRFVIDGDQYEPDLKSIRAIVADAIPDLERKKITLGIENHDRFKARELVDLMDTLESSQVGICLDCVNSMGAGEGLESVIDRLAPYTVNLHIKDFIVKRLAHNMGFTITGVPAGQGLTNVPRLMDSLSKYSRCQSAVLEQWVPFDTNIETTSAKEKQWAVASINYLRSLPYFDHKQVMTR